MTWIVAILLIFFASTSDVGAQQRGSQRTIYISSSRGSDTNPGTKSQPRRSIASLTTSERTGSTILLRRGDVFYESMTGLNGCVVDAWGSGDNPALVGFFFLNNPQAWQQVKPNIWRLDLQQKNNFRGFAYQSNNFSETVGNIGVIYNPSVDKLYGNIVSSIDDMKSEGDVFTSSICMTEQVTSETFRYVYLRMTESPTRLGRLYFSASAFAVRTCSNTTFRHLQFVGFGNNAVQCMSDMEFSDCRFDIIGGSILLSSSGKWVRYGNGIEANVTSIDVKNVVVSNCTFSRIYDTATTIQGHPRTTHRSRNIIFKNNTIFDCSQAYEWNINPPTADVQTDYQGSAFVDNVLLNCGDNRFGIPNRWNNCALMSTDQRQPHMEITGNTIYRCNYLGVGKQNMGIHDNVVYLTRDNYLNNYAGETYPAIFPTDESRISAFRRRMADNSRIYVVDSNDKMAKRLEKMLVKLRQQATNMTKKVISI